MLLLKPDDVEAVSITEYLRSLPVSRIARPTMSSVDMKRIWLYSDRRQPDLVDILVKLLEETGWTKVELAKKLGVTTQTIAKILNSQQKGMTPETKLRLDRILGQFPDLHDQFMRLKLRGVGRPPTVTRVY